jgi:hypothetical protein
MIQLHGDYLYFQLEGGEQVPCSATSVTVEIMGAADSALDPVLVEQAAEAVIYYFKHDLNRDSMSVGEFSEALERVLGSLGCTIKSGDTSAVNLPPVQLDLWPLARSAGPFELGFFHELRKNMRAILKGAPKMIQCVRLRDAVKILTGVRRWNNECRALSERIVIYLRALLRQESGLTSCTLIVR